MPPRQDIDRADPIGVFLEPALETEEPRLAGAVCRIGVAAGRAFAAAVARRYGDEDPAAPRQLVSSRLAAALSISGINAGAFCASG